MYGHKNFNAVQDRWDEFWAGKNNYPLYSVTIPKDGKKTKDYPPYLMGFNGNYQAVADMLSAWVESCRFFGEAIPNFNVSFGADDFAAFCGSDLVLGKSEDTSWSVHTLKKLNNANISFDKNGKWWERITVFYEVLKKSLGDSVFLSAPTLTAGLDALAALYGASSLLLDMLDNPEAVRNALLQLNIAYDKAVEACKELFEYEKYGSITRHGMYSRGIAGVVQCDISCMISPYMFEEFAFDNIRHEISLLDAAEYHLDGPGALKHLEKITEILKLRVIQWQPGAGEAAEKDWTDLYRNVLLSGKGLILYKNVKDAASLTSKYNSKDLFVVVGGIKTQTEAEVFLENMRSSVEGGK